MTRKKDIKRIERRIIKIMKKKVANEMRKIINGNRRRAE